MRVFLEELDIQIGRLSKVDPNVGGPHLIS